MLCARPTAAAQEEAAARAVIAEVARGVLAVSGLPAAAEASGWIAIRCHSVAMARWLSEAILRENVEARAEGRALLLPVSAEFTLEGEVKSLVTVVAKTTDYWFNHLPPEARQALEAQAALEGWKQRILGWFGR